MPDRARPPLETDDSRDRQLLAQWAEGDRGAGDELTIRYFRRLRRYFFHRVPGEHEDLVQETFFQLARSAVSYRGEAPVCAFVFKIARNVMLQHLRKVGRQPDIDPYTTSLGEALGRRPSSMLAESEEHQLLGEAMQDISLADQDLLTLYYWDGLGGPELAAIFDVVEATIRSRIRRALQRLRDRFLQLLGTPHERTPTEALVEDWLRELAKFRSCT